MANGWRASRRLDKRSCERYPQVTAKLAREELWYNARKMLRHKKAWRRLFGLRGDLWYYSEEAGNKEYLLKIAQFIVPFLAITVSGILSYKAIVFNQESFAAQHQPKLSVEGVIYYQQFFDGMARTGLARISHRTGFLREGGEVQVTESRRDRRLSVAGGRKTACNATKRRIPTSVGN